MPESLRPFLAAAAERCWPAAVRAIAARGGLVLDELVDDPEAQKAVLLLIDRAGPPELREFKRWLRSPASPLEIYPSALWRPAVHLAISDALAAAARNRAIEGQFNFIPGLLTRMLLVPQARFRQEHDLERLLTEVTTAIGIAEEVAVIAYPDAENLPTAPGPHISTMEAAPGIGPSMGIVSEVMGLLLASHRYPALRWHCLLAALHNAHWPTWRSLEWLGQEKPEVLRSAAATVFRHPRRFSIGARKHMSALLAGYKFESLPREF